MAQETQQVRRDSLPMPAGTVTFLMTDIEGSTRLWSESPHAMFRAIARHHALMDATLARYGGRRPRDQGEGDSVFAGFARATDAVAAALEVQKAFAQEPWPEGAVLRVRMSLHTGEAEVRDFNYYGISVSRCARIRALAHGSQTLLSQTAADLARDALPEGATLRDLGEHVLKDFERSEHVWQLMHPDLQADFPPLRTGFERPDSLPVPLTTFVGRQDEIIELKDLVHRNHIVTLTGPGGCGKSRLAIEVAKDLVGYFEDGVHFVGLAALDDPNLFVSTVAQRVGLQESASAVPFRALKDFLRDKHMLIVLDNFERLMAASGLVAEILSECPLVTLLVTSRASLRLSGEREYPVQPLQLPGAGWATKPETLLENESVRLFVDRARANKPDFRLNDDNAAAVAEICQRLDGLPLAIELAAVRVKLLPPQALLQRLSHRLEVLTGGPRDVPARQQTLRNAIDWDYEMLEPGERELFRRLSVFTGFTLEAAEAVCTAAGALSLDLLDGLESLVTKSLVRQQSGQSEPRFLMLQTIREYAHEILLESGEEAATRQRHSEFYLALAEEGEKRLRGPDQITWLERLEMEHDNLRAALGWSQQGTDPMIEMRLVAALLPFWSTRGHFSEAQRWAESALKRSEDDDTLLRVKIVSGAATLARARGDFEEARELLNECIELEKALDDDVGLAQSIKDLGNLEADQNNFQAAIELYEESLALARKLDDKLGVARALNNLGYAARVKGDPEQATKLLEESVELFREMGDEQGIARGYMNLAAVTRDDGDLKGAEKYAKDSLVMWRRLGDRWDVTDSLEELAFNSTLQEDLYRSVVLLSASDALRRAIGAPRAPSDDEAFEHSINISKAKLTKQEFDASWEKGASMRLEEAIDYALASP